MGLSTRIPELKQCGFGIPLSVGAKVIAIFCCLLNGIGFLGCLFVIIKTEIDERNPEETTEGRHNDSYIQVIAVMFLLLCTLKGTLAFCLWYGVKEHKSSFVLPWAILTTAFTIIFTFVEFLLIIHSSNIFAPLLLGAILMLLYYCNLIVYSHFRQLLRQKNLPQTLNDAGET